MEDDSQYPNPSAHSEPFNPIQEQRRRGSEHGSHSLRHGSRDPSDDLHHGIAIRKNELIENELIKNIDDDIAEAAASMEKKVIDSSLESDDARPLDSNLICPLCGRQYRIGQIQHYRHHVDNCTNKPI